MRRVQPQVCDAKAQPDEWRLEILQQGRLSCPMRSDDRGAIAQAREPRSSACRPALRKLLPDRQHAVGGEGIVTRSHARPRPPVPGDMTISRRSTEGPGSRINSIAQMIEMSFPEKL